MSSSFSSLEEVSHSIRQEIIRFESVHPSIYAIYDLVDAIDDKNISDSLRQLVVSIEDAFVNSQEWTLSHRVPDIKLGLLGSIQSGKSALVHRYLTGTYLHEESPEGGRFKKEISLENQSHLLLIRDEGGPPDQQFSHWIDGVIFVFSLENFESYELIYDYYARLSTYRDLTNLPILLVGTQDSNCESYVRVIDDSRARKLANDLKKCAYYETCAAYGLNVERVFQDACLKILQIRSQVSGKTSRPITPQFSSTVPSRPHGMSPPEPPVVTAAAQLQHPMYPQGYCRNTGAVTKAAVSIIPASTSAPVPVTTSSERNGRNMSNIPPNAAVRRADVHNNAGFEPDALEEGKADNNESITPSSTPTHSRKNRRKSNLFQKKNEDDKDREKRINGIGSGRAIPLKQGFLYKRTCKPLSKEWKTKKYVTLTDDARLTYHPSIHDYMDNTHGKEIDLSRTTVKIPGVPFRQVGGRITSNGLLRTQVTDANAGKPNSAASNVGPVENCSGLNVSSTSGTKESASVKKRHRRVKSNPKTTTPDGYDSEGYEFQLISMDRQWHFEATGQEERDEWVMFIERAIMTRLQLNESNKRTRASAALGSGNSFAGSASNVVAPGSRSTSDNNSLNSGRSGAGDTNEIAATEHLVQSIKSSAGNDFCADCGASNPEWASLNLGTMVCIGCSGIHRQLGTHISRIRSLHLDEWSPESVAVMCAIGNTLANSVWEAAVPVNAGNRKKPESSSSREEKEAWIRAKYVHQEFLPPLPYPDAPLQQQLIDAIARQDTRQVVLCLALATPDMVNAPYSRQDPRAAIHIAATLGNMVYLQLLLWYNGDPTITDHEGRNAFYYAHCSQKYDCAEFLLRSGCPKQLIPPSLVGLSAGSGPMSRLVHPSPVLSQQPVSHQLQTGPPLQSQHPVTLDALGSALPDPFVPHGSTNANIEVNQPHHFSHLQQQSCALPSLPSLISGVSNQASTGTFLVPQAPVQPPQSFTYSGPTSTSSTGMVGSNSAGLVYHGPNNSNFPSSSVSYGSSVNQAIGATLPRRRAPPLAPPILQPFNRPNIGSSQLQSAISSGTHRPHSGAVLPDRTVVGSARPIVSSSHHPLPSQIPPILARPSSNVGSSTSTGHVSAHHLVQSNQEVGI